MIRFGRKAHFGKKTFRKLKRESLGRLPEGNTYFQDVPFNKAEAIELYRSTRATNLR